MAGLGRRNKDFTKATVTTLAERAFFLCSNPVCRKMTTGPHSNLSKSLRSGEAAHIYGASGARHNPHLTDREIKNIKNGIWLCADCHKIIDTDPSLYSVGKLQKWRSIHEEFVKVLRSNPNYSSVLQLIQPTIDEVQKAKELIDILENKRSFYNSLHYEIPAHVFISIQDVRKILLEINIGLYDGFLKDRIQKMLTVLNQFLDTIYNVDLNTLKIDLNDSDWIKFETSLIVMRKIVGVLILEISDKFLIHLNSNLKKITPNN